MKILKISLTYIVLIILVSSISAQSTLNDYFNKVIPELIEKKRDREYKEQLLEIEREKLELERQRLQLEKSKQNNNPSRYYDELESDKSGYITKTYSSNVREKFGVYVITPIDTLNKANLASSLGNHYGTYCLLSPIKQADIALVIMVGDSTLTLHSSYDNIFALEKDIEKLHNPDGNFGYIHIYGIDENLGVERLDYGRKYLSNE